MLNRHNIRVKVLQTLYAQDMAGETSPVLAERYYMRLVHNGYKLYLYNIYLLQQIAQQNMLDYDSKRAKLLPTDEDLKATRKLYDNPIMEFLRLNEDWQKLVKSELLHHLVSDDLAKRLYQRFTKTEYYQTYISLLKTPLKEHQYCLVNLYKMVVEDEDFREELETYFPTWDEDISLLYGAVKNTIREFPNKPHFYLEYKTNPEFLNDFGKTLLYQVIQHDKQAQPLITEKLQNWAEDRIAAIDTLIIKMALCEFWFHPSIPTKVTIDEYVSIAKEYSTDKSKRFINGILDRLMRDQLHKGHIQKTGRGLIDNNPADANQPTADETSEN